MRQTRRNAALAARLAFGLLLASAGPVSAAASQRALQHRLGVPERIARVTDGSLRPGETVPEFILVQDIHRHPEAQNQIAAIILHGHARWSCDTVFLEGLYAGSTPRLPTDDGTVVPLQRMVADGRLSGAEMAAAMNREGSLRLSGLEDPEVYQANVAAYTAVVGMQEQALRELQTSRLVATAWDIQDSIDSADQAERLELLLRLKIKYPEYMAYKSARRPRPASSVLAKALAQAERFYELADERSDVFLRHALESREKGSKILVIGGYHTARLASALKAMGRSYAVLTPQITQSGYEPLYAQKMQETIQALRLSAEK